MRRDSEKLRLYPGSGISTHAPRVRRDARILSTVEVLDDFYSRASCEARRCRHNLAVLVRNFYSRASCEARRSDTLPRTSPGHFYSRASCEARPFQLHHYYFLIVISTHAPRVRRDGDTRDAFSGLSISTHAPRVRRDSVQQFVNAVKAISTHAPRVRRDVCK